MWQRPLPRLRTCSFGQTLGAGSCRPRAGATTKCKATGQTPQALRKNKAERMVKQLLAEGDTVAAVAAKAVADARTMVDDVEAYLEPVEAPKDAPTRAQIQLDVQSYLTSDYYKTLKRWLLEDLSSPNHPCIDLQQRAASAKDLTGIEDVALEVLRDGTDYSAFAQAFVQRVQRNRNVHTRAIKELQSALTLCTDAANSSSRSDSYQAAGFAGPASQPAGLTSASGLSEASARQLELLRGMLKKLLACEQQDVYNLTLFQAYEWAGLIGCMWRKSSVVLDVAIQRILGSNSPASAAWSAHRPRLLSELLPRWLCQLNYRPSQASCRLLLEAFGDSALMQPLDSLVAAAPFTPHRQPQHQQLQQLIGNGEEAAAAATAAAAAAAAATAAAASASAPAVAASATAAMVSAVLLRWREGKCSAADAAAWLGRAAALGPACLERVVKAPVGGELRVQLQGSPGKLVELTEVPLQQGAPAQVALGKPQEDIPLGMFGGIIAGGWPWLSLGDAVEEVASGAADAAMEEVLGSLLAATVDTAAAQDAEAVVRACFARVAQVWDKRLAQAATSALQGLGADSRGRVLRDTATWQAAWQLCFPPAFDLGHLLGLPDAATLRAIGRGEDAGPADWAAAIVNLVVGVKGDSTPLLQLLSLPEAPAAAQRYEGWVGGAQSVSQLLEDAIDLELALPSPPRAALGRAVELLQLCKTYQVSVPEAMYEHMIRVSAAGEQHEQCVAVLVAYLDAPHLATSLPCASSLQLLLLSGGTVMTAQLLAATRHHPIERRTSLVQALLQAGAAIRDGPCCLAIVKAAAAQQVPVGPDVCSALATAFLDSPAAGAASDSGTEDGIRAADAAFVHWVTGSQDQQQRQHSKSSDSGSNSSRPLEQLSKPARKALALRLAAGSPETDFSSPSGSAFASLRPLALDLFPDRTVAAALLVPSSAAAVTIPRTQLQQLLVMADQQGWDGLSSTALRAVRQLGPEEQRAALAAGAAEALARLLLRDAATAPKTAAIAAPDQSALSPLLGFLQGQGLVPVAPLLSHKGWRALMKQLLTVCDAVGAQAEAAAAAELLARHARDVAELAVSAAAGAGAEGWGGQAAGKGGTSVGVSSSGVLPETVWFVQQALLDSQQSLRRPAALGLACHFLEQLQAQGWHLGGDSAAEVQGISPAIVACTEFLAWLTHRKAITAAVLPPSGRNPPPPPLLPWLLPLMADLCRCLAGTGPAWATSFRDMEPGHGLMVAVQVCRAKGTTRPLLQLLSVYVDKHLQMPLELAELAVEAVADLGQDMDPEFGELGGFVLRALRLGPKLWLSDEGRTAAACKKTLDTLTAGQAQAALTLLVKDCGRGDSSWKDPLAVTRAMSAVSELLLPPHQRSPLTAGALLLALEARAVAAAAAAEHADAAQGQGQKQAKGRDQLLDPAHHSSEAWAAVRSLVVQPYLSAEQRRLTGTEAEQQAAEAGLGAPLLPSASVYLGLLSVYESARQPGEAVRVAMELAEGKLPLVQQPGCSALEEVVAGAMRVANGAGLRTEALTLFEELLIREGGVSHVGVMAQVIAAIDSDKGASLNERLEAAAGTDTYLVLDDVLAGGPGVAVRPLAAWLEEQQRRRRRAR